MSSPPTDPKLVGRSFIPKIPLAAGELRAAVNDGDWERVFQLSNDLLKEGKKEAGSLRNFAWGVLCGRETR